MAHLKQSSCHEWLSFGNSKFLCAFHSNEGWFVFKWASLKLACCRFTVLVFIWRSNCALLSSSKVWSAGAWPFAVKNLKAVWSQNALISTGSISKNSLAASSSSRLRSLSPYINHFHLAVSNSWPLCRRLTSAWSRRSWSWSSFIF